MHVTGVFNALVLRKALEPLIDQLKVAKSQLEMTDGYKPIVGRDADRVSVTLISNAFKDTSKVSRRLRRRHSHTHVHSPHAAYITGTLLSIYITSLPANKVFPESH